MTNFFIHGFNGKMGNAIRTSVRGDICVYNIKEFDFKSKELSLNSAIIDFSCACALDAVLDYSAENKLPVVIGTTGFSEAQINKIIHHSSKISVFLSSNFSIGMNVLFEAVALAAKLTNWPDISIFESHHKGKKDSPSGSALSLKNRIVQNIEANCDLNLTVNSFRGGGIRGEHSVMFCAQDEVLKFSHEALDRNVFATGAIAAADWLINNKNRTGLYSMRDLLKIHIHS